jgi:hypothetical protein
MGLEQVRVSNDNDMNVHQKVIKMASWVASKDSLCNRSSLNNRSFCTPT